MKKEDSTESNFSNVISIDPYEKSYCNESNSFLKKNDSPAYSADQYAISYLNTKNFITTQLEINKNIADEDIVDVIENRVYEELALDMAVEYNISYIESKTYIDENSKLFHVFVADPVVVEETFKDVVTAIKYIDIIIPSPLLLRSLYDEKIIDETGIHTFIYLQNGDAFLTIYNENEYVYSKSLKFSLDELYENFCEAIGESIERKTFNELLLKKALSSEDNIYEEQFINLFNDLLIHANDVLTYAKRALNIDRIDKIYIGCELGNIDSLAQYTTNYLGHSTFNFEFDYGFENKDYTNQIQSLLHLFLRVDSENRYDEFCNFTIYERPPKFIKRKSGMLIIVSVVSIVASLIYPLFYYSSSYIEDFKASVLQEEYKVLHNEKTVRENTIKLKLSEQKKEKEKLKIQEDEFNESKDTLIKIHDVKVNYAMKSKILCTFTTDLNKFKVQITDIKYDEKDKDRTFMLTLNSKSDKSIAKLLKYLTDKKRELYRFTIEKILYNEESKRYISDLKVVIK
ncbi:MAG: hypothetical protein GQ570_06345 [Helicobacteraceae bacterium]|nr:hypothetical protein [Helicobacteraceae bacterium]